MKMAAGEDGQAVQGIFQDCPWHRTLETCQVSTASMMVEIHLFLYATKKK